MLRKNVCYLQTDAPSNRCWTLCSLSLRLFSWKQSDRSRNIAAPYLQVLCSRWGENYNFTIKAWYHAVVPAALNWVGQVSSAYPATLNALLSLKERIIPGELLNVVVAIAGKSRGCPPKKTKKNVQSSMYVCSFPEEKKFPVNEFMKASKKEIRSVSNHPDSYSKVNYIITQVILAFWLVLGYDLLEHRRIDDDSARLNFFWIFWILNLNQSQFFN